MNKRGFTLIELLAVIVILAVILAVSIPSITALVSDATRSAFNNDARLVLKAIDYKSMEDDTYAIESIDISKVSTDLKIAINNYQSVDVSKNKNNEPYIIIYGKNKWADMIACGSYKKMNVVDAIEKCDHIKTMDFLGSGTVGDPYQIWYFEHLSAISTNRTSHFILMRDLDFQDVDSYITTSNKTLWTTGTGWNPINTIFMATFNGQNHTIYNLYINRPAKSNVGLFSQSITNNSSYWIGNIRLVNVNVTGYDYTGAILGEGGNIFNSYVEGHVKGHDYVGLQSGQQGYVNITSNHDCYTEGTVEGNIDVGGMAGRYVGYNARNLYSNATVTGVTEVGGLFGETGASISNVYSTGKVTGSTLTGGLVGNIAMNGFTDSYWDTETSGQATSAGGTGLTTAQMKQQASYTSWDFSTVWGIDSAKNNGYPYLKLFNN